MFLEKKLALFMVNVNGKKIGYQKILMLEKIRNLCCYVYKKFLVNFRLSKGNKKLEIE